MGMFGHRGIYSSRRIKARQKIRKLLTVAVLVGCIVFSGFLVWVSRLPQLQIERIAVFGVSAFGKTDIEEFVEKKIHEYYFGVIPKSNIFLYPRNALLEELLDEFPRLEAVSVSREKEGVLSVRVLERKPYYVWCGEDVSSTENCHFVDLKGIIFSEAPGFSGNAYFIFYGPVRGVSVRETNTNQKPLGYYFIDAL